MTKALLALLLLAGPASAVDNGQWGHDPATSEWFKSLHNPNGLPCCDYTDGTRIEDPASWRDNKDGSYEVFARDQWVHVPKEKVVTAINRVGYAILWWAPGVAGPYCFLPGTRV